VPVKAAGVRQARHAGGLGELAQRQLRAGPLGAPQPGLHLGPGRDANQRIVERCPVSVEDGAFAARIPDVDLRAGPLGTRPVRRQRQFGALLPVKFQGENLAQPGNAVAFQHDIAPGPQLQAVQRGLERELAPVHRGGQRKDGLLEIPACRTEAGELRAEIWLPSHRITVSCHQLPG
jgi:hypothetical protein